jgi:hypothetical protein
MSSLAEVLARCNVAVRSADRIRMIQEGSEIVPAQLVDALAEAASAFDATANQCRALIEELKAGAVNV